MNEQEKLKALVEEKRHDDILAALKAIAEKDDNGLLDAINSQADKIVDFVEAIKNIPTPNVEVETNQDKVVHSLEQLAQQILVGQEQILLTINALIIENTKLKEWDFIVHKEFGRISKVTAKQLK